MSKFIKVLLAILAPQLVFTFLDIDQPRALALVVSVLILWISEIVSLAYTALLIPVLASLLGLLTYKEALLSFSNPILFLFISCFFLSCAFSRTGLDKRVAYFIFKFDFFSKNSTRLLYTCIGLAWTLSMWISNTAACAILIPIVKSLYEEIEQSSNGNPNTFKKLLIGMAYGASIGGLCTPVGSPPNLLALAILKNIGVEISFFKWVLIAMPISFLMLACLILLLNILLKDDCIQIDNSKFHAKYNELGPITSQQVVTFISFCLCIFLWINPGLFQQVGKIFSLSLPILSLSEAGFLGTSLLFILNVSGNRTEKRPVLSWSSVKDKIDWGVILLFGGGLCLGQIMDSSGVAKSLASMLSQAPLGVLTLCLLITLLGVILSELGSNTASAALLLPIIITMPVMGSDISLLITFILCASFGASFGFMLPVSTPANALVFATGRLDIKDLVRAGIVFDILGFFLIGFILYGFYNLNFI